MSTMNKTPSRFEALFGKLALGGGKPTVVTATTAPPVGVEKSAITTSEATTITVMSPRHTLKRNLRQLQAVSKRGEFPTDQRILRLISVLLSQRLTDEKVERLVRNVIEQSRTTHPESAQRLEQDWARMPASKGVPKNTPPRVAKRPAAIRIPLVRVHNERMQEIELLVHLRPAAAAKV